jgi:hypothetical protein
MRKSEGARLGNAPDGSSTLSQLLGGDLHAVFFRSVVTDGLSLVADVTIFNANTISDGHACDVMMTERRSRRVVRGHVTSSPLVFRFQRFFSFALLCAVQSKTQNF